jgi:hypothetical protein
MLLYKTVCRALSDCHLLASNKWMQFERKHDLHYPYNATVPSRYSNHPYIDILDWAITFDDLSTAIQSSLFLTFSIYCQPRSQLSLNRTAMAPTKPRRRRAITTEQRIALRSYAQQHRSLNQQQLASWFEQQFGHRPSQGTISGSLSARSSELDQRSEGPYGWAARYCTSNSFSVPSFEYLQLRRIWPPLEDYSWQRPSYTSYC